MKLVAVVALLIAGAPSTSKMKAAQPAYWTWGNQRDWVLLETNSGRSEHLSSFDGHSAKNLAVSSDGQRFVFQDPRTDQLYAWTRDGVARLLDAAQGFYADPTFSEDGETVYYAHSDSGGIGAHGERDWAQIWSVPWAGGQPKKVTETPGCHSNPNVRGKTIYFVHANCSGDFGISAVTYPHLDDHEIVPRTRQVDGAFERTGRVYYTDKEITGLSVKWCPARGGPPKTLFVLPADSDEPRLFLTLNGDLIYQNKGQVLRRQGERAVPVATYSWGEI